MIFFFAKIDVTRISLDEKVKVMLTKFDSDAKQLEAKLELESVTLSRVMRENDTSKVNFRLESPCPAGQLSVLSVSIRNSTSINTK